MALRKHYVGLSASQEKVLQKLAAKLGLDRSNTLRYCLSRIAEQEGIGAERTKESGARG